MRGLLKAFAFAAAVVVLVPPSVWSDTVGQLNRFVAGDIASAEDVNSNFSEIRSAVNGNDELIEENRDRIAELERQPGGSTTQPANPIVYTYNQISLDPGSTFSVLGTEYEVASFDVVSMADHSIYSVKLPVKLRFDTNNLTHPTYGLSIATHENGYGSAVAPHSVDGYPASINSHVSTFYNSAPTNSSSSTRVEFDAAGDLETASISKTQVTVRKGSARVHCRPPLVDLSHVPSNVNNANIAYATETLRIYYNDGTPTESGLTDLSPYDEIARNCIESDSYYKQEYRITHSLLVTTTIYLDNETTFYVSRSTTLDAHSPAADVAAATRDFAGTIDIQSELPVRSERNTYRQELVELNDYVVIHQ